MACRVKAGGAEGQDADLRVFRGIIVPSLHYRYVGQ